MKEVLSNHILKDLQIKDGQRLILRKPIPTADDAEKMIEFLNTIGGESDNLLFGKDEFRLTVEQEIDYIKSLSNVANTLMILGIIKKNIVGIAQLSGNNRKRIAHNSELSISVKKEYWRKGIGSIMMEELIKFAREQGGIKTISLGVKASNLNAIEMYEKFGFIRVGQHRNYFNVNGIFDDEILMDLYLF